jgi:hypothetical protein
MQLEEQEHRKIEKKPIPPAAITLMTELTPHLQNLAAMLTDAEIDEVNLSLGMLGTFHWRTDFKYKGICPSKMNRPGTA